MVVINCVASTNFARFAFNVCHLIVDLVPLYGGSCKTNNAFPTWFNCLDGTCISILQLRDTFQDCPQEEDEGLYYMRGNHKRLTT